MKTAVLRLLTTGCLMLLMGTATQGANLLAPGDFIIAIDTDPGSANSSYPDGEPPINAIDGIVGSKYLNFGKLNTGLIASPFFPTTAQSLVLTTANDAEPRDPASWQVYGTNDLITSTDNSFGDQENWTLIGEGTVALPAARGTVGPVLSFANSTLFNSYRVVFPTVKDPNNANSMQVAEVALYSTSDGTGAPIFNIANPVIAIGLDVQPDARSPDNEGPANLLDGTGPVLSLQQSDYPGNEGPQNVVDGTLNKYLNFGKEHAGFIVTPASGSSQVQSFTLTTANDEAPRDPASWQLFGTNEPIVSLDNSYGIAENWTLIDEGALVLPTARDTLSAPVVVTNPNLYSSYKMLFPTLLDGGAANSMQIAEASFYESTDGTGIDILNPGDAVLAVDGTVTLGEESKYLNFGKENSGVIVTPAGASTVTGFEVLTANDAPSRDPASWELYGTNDPITSAPFSQGDQENWVLIDSGTFTEAQVPTDRQTAGETVPVTNSTSYRSYRLLIPTLRDSAAEDANSMQLAGLQLVGEFAGSGVDTDNDGDVDGTDFLALQRTDPSLIAAWSAEFGTTAAQASGAAVPEPASGVALLLGLAGLLVRGGVPGSRRV
jgi:hypothetical protein